MSIFDGQTDQTQTTTDATSWVDKVVGDKGEQFRDPEALAKSLFNSNLHIKTLEEENAKFKERQVQEDFGKQLLEELRRQPPASGEPAATDTTNAGGPTENTTQSGPEDIKKLVEEAIANREHTRTREQNIAETDKVMRERFGDQAQAELTKRAKELGVEVEYLADVAGKSPSAFLRMIGEAPQVQSNSTVDSTVNTATFSQGSGKRNWAYYKDLMKKDNKRYRSREIQDQMERDYAEQGSTFWGS